MGVIIVEASVLLLVVVFVIYLAMDDRRNQRIRAQEDCNKVLEPDQEREQLERGEQE